MSDLRPTADDCCRRLQKIYNVAIRVPWLCTDYIVKHIRATPGAVILGGGFASLEAARNLGKHGVRVCIFGDASAVARFSRLTSRFMKWPKGMKNEELPDFLIAMADRWDIRGWVLFPSSDEHLRILAQDTFVAKHFILTTPPWETAKHLFDKRLTYTLAQKTGVPTPRGYDLRNGDWVAVPDIEFPVVLKPAITPHFLETTNRKAYRADNRIELQNLYEGMLRVIPASEIIVQELIPEPSKNLFSFAGYFKQGEPIVGLSVKRTRQFPVDFGRSSSFVVTVDVPELRELASQLLRAIRYTGLAELEFMWNAKRARFELLDVNARLWSWHGLASAAGLDLPYIAFADAVGRTPAHGAVRHGVKWVRLVTDVRAAAQAIRGGTMSIRQYLTSLRGTTAFSVFSLSDPLPSFTEPLLLLLDHFIRFVSKRGRAQHQKRR